MNTTDIDFLAVGDIVTDAFIKLNDAHVHKKIDDVPEELCVRFGDKIPFESVEVIRAVGNSANAAVSASRIGITSGLMAVVGDDTEGKACIETLEKDNVSTAFMETDPQLPTNYHYVLWYGVERTILVKHSPFVRKFPMDLKPPKWIYLTSLGENTEGYHHEIAEYLKMHPEIKLAFQPGTFQIKLGIEKLRDIYAHTEVFFCNVDEAQRILNSKETDKKVLMNELHDLGPKIIVMTDGIDGAYARDEDGTVLFMPVYPHQPFERTGAGDAFASTLTSALLLGKSLQEALLWAPINAMSVTQYVGAQKGLLTEPQVLAYLQKAPPSYKSEII